MITLFSTYYFGEAEIAYWEWAVAIVYVLGLYVYFARIKNVRIRKEPEYKYLLWGLMAKLFAGIVFSLIYFYYYQGGDSVAYFYGAVSMRNLAMVDPLAYLNQLFGDNTLENWNVYTWETGKPFQYLYFDDRTFFVIRITSLLAILSFNSYLNASLLIASASFFGIWACFRTFVSYFPQQTGKLAIAFLFMPSVIFWGSAILKDTFTISAVFWFIHSIDEIFFKKRNITSRVIILVLSSMIMVLIKPYIFMTLFPVMVLWLFYFRVVQIKNLLVKFVVVPIVMIGTGALCLSILDSLGDSLDKFALDEALNTIEVTQMDLAKVDWYGANSFNIGEFDGTWSGVFSKFPVATNAALFRPYIWESSSVVVAMSGLENLWVLWLTLLVIWQVGPGFVLRAMIGNPLILMSMSFALLFGFIVGVTTPNFGALVRFKIPLIPLYISALYLIKYLGQLKRVRENQGLRFDIRQFRRGSAHLDEFAGIQGKRHKTTYAKPGASLKPTV
ncbi:MAG: hypothetical protein IPI00_00415 [Flavobacteriales bacterium]|nr:hypothetical protein [Flavobacteriales bacterium]MBK7238654.1 hypothetical protein [Flavobacteriales bacterium]MBK9536437.1 hypothetical protein [Flavobacteriales bacterium]MBP9137340.1 hypothetical protein [Flavobacteriales bacterium]HQV50684.1 hypothetical protein [Flavobacteriales bacterium]